MKKTTKKIMALPLLALAFLPVLTNAEKVDLNERGDDRAEERGRPENHRGNEMEDMRKNMMGTSTRPMGGKNIGGVVTVVGTSSFSMESPSRTGTTTTSVTVDSSTVFRSGTTTASLANLTVGQRVSVIGSYATSTNTIAAKQVMLINAKNMDNREKHKEKRFKDKVLGWFKKMF